MIQKPRIKEENVIVLDFLPHGYPEDSRPFHRKEAIVQAIGKEHFVLLELIPSEGQFLKPYDEVYIGEGKREKISYIKGTLDIMKLTQTAKSELPFMIKKIVDENEDRFIEFFNTSGPISLRAHQLELLPGIGKRHAKDLLSIRQNDPFSSFEDIKKKVSSMPDPKKAIIDRIITEIEGKDRFRLFVRV